MIRIVRFVPSADRPHRVVALALPGVIVLDLAAPAHLFGHGGAPHYRFSLAGVRRGPIPTSTGFNVIADRGLGALRSADTVVVPGFQSGGAPTAADRADRAVAAAALA